MREADPESLGQATSSLVEDGSREHVERLRRHGVLAVVRREHPPRLILLDASTNPHNPGVDGGQVRAHFLYPRTRPSPFVARPAGHLGDLAQKGANLVVGHTLDVGAGQAPAATRGDATDESLTDPLLPC